jgi:hypothetical protein
MASPGAGRRLATAASFVRENSMSVTDYVVDILLIVIIFRQVRPRELTLRTAVYRGSPAG